MNTMSCRCGDVCFKRFMIHAIARESVVTPGTSESTTGFDKAVAISETGPIDFSSEADKKSALEVYDRLQQASASAWHASYASY